MISLTQHFQVEVAASLTGSIISQAGVTSCVIDLGLDDLHACIQAQEYEVGGWNKNFPFFKPGHSGGWGPISNTK